MRTLSKKSFAIIIAIFILLLFIGILVINFSLKSSQVSQQEFGQKIKTNDGKIYENPTLKSSYVRQQEFGQKIKTNDGKIYENPTFNDLGFSNQVGERYEMIVRIVKVHKIGSDIFVDVQTDKNSSSLQKVLFYQKDVLIPLYWESDSSYPVSGNLGRAYLLKTTDEAFKKLNSLTGKGILIQIELGNNLSGIEKYLDCNKKWVDDFKNNKNGDLNCTPAVGSFIKYVKN